MVRPTHDAGGRSGGPFNLSLDEQRLLDRQARATAEVQRLVQALGPLPPPSPRPSLIVMVGLPGTGKSTFSRALAGRLPTVRVETDAVRSRLFRQPGFSPIEHAVVFHRSHALLDELLGRGQTVIFDATNLEEKHRKRVYQIAERRRAPVFVVHTVAPEEVVRRRLETREQASDGNSLAGWDVYLRMLPTMQPIRRPHWEVDTSRDVSQALGEIVRAITEQ